MNNKGQITAEYMLLLSIFLIIIILSIHTITNESEKNTIVTAAQLGAQEAIDKNGYAMYYNDTFNNYQQNYKRLLTPTQIKIISIDLIEEDKTIYIQTTATTTSLTETEKFIVGSRINYYIRKSITETFQKQSSNIYYNPAKSENYIIKTQTVIWK